MDTRSKILSNGLIDDLVIKIKLQAIDLKQILLDYPNLTDEQSYKLCLESVKINGKELKNVPHNLITLELCRIAVKNGSDDDILNHVPQEFKTHQLYLEAVQSNGIVLKDIPNNLSTYEEICLAAVAKNGRALETIPEVKRSYDMCLNALLREGGALDFIPKKYFDSTRDLDQYTTLCNLAISRNQHALNFAPIKEHLTYDLCMNAVKHFGEALCYVPPQWKDKNLCITAIKQDGKALAFIPDSLKQKIEDYFELCLEATYQDGSALQYVDFDNLPDEKIKILCDIAVKQTGLALKHVPAKFQTSLLCEKAVKQNANALEFVLDKNMITKEMCTKAVKNNARSIQHVPIKFKSDDLYIEALIKEPQMHKRKNYFSIPESIYLGENLLKIAKANGEILEHIKMDQALVTYPICKAACEQDPFALKHVPEEFMTEELCLISVAKNVRMLEFVPPRFLTEKMCEQVKNNGYMLEFVPKHFRTLDLCINAVNQDSAALQFVPENLKQAVVEKVTLEKILSNNYKARHYLPANIDYQTQITQFLSKIDYVILTKEMGFKDDHELRDTFSVYSTHKKRAGKTIHTDVDDADNLFKDLTNFNKSFDKYYHLTLLGHANLEDPYIANLTVPNIVKLPQKYNIQSINLAGCNTAKSLKLKEEETKILAFQKKYVGQNHSTESNISANESKQELEVIKKAPKPKAVADSTSAFMPIPDNVAETTYQDLLNKKKKNELYLLTTNDNEDYPYALIHIQKDPKNPNVIIKKSVSLDKDQFKNLQNKLNKSKNFDFTTPLNNKTPKPLSLKDIELLESTFVSKFNKYEKSHTTYDTDKEEIPALKGITINEDEKEKIQRSLLKQIFDALETIKFNRDITIKGYTKGLFVDASQKSLITTRTYPYNSGYKHSFYGTQKENINYEKVKGERAQVIEQMKEGDVHGETTAKWVRIKYRKK